MRDQLSASRARARRDTARRPAHPRQMGQVRSAFRLDSSSVTVFSPVMSGRAGGPNAPEPERDSILMF
jgi:hypothetical protein